MVDAQASVRRLHWWTDLHRSAGANLRLGACLAFVAGATNAGGFLALGYYTSHMTGFLSSLADNLGLEALARRAVAFATAKLGRIGPHLPSPDDVRQLARRVDVAVLAS